MEAIEGQERLQAELKIARAQGRHTRAARKTVGRLSRWLKSEECRDILRVKTAKILQYVFEGALKQVYKAGLLPLDTSLDFLDIDKMWVKLPESERRRE